jgi:acyl-CoA synthetase (AMP-forming)/AMP-acid ligase II
MIISGGFNVYPSEVEQVIWSHPAVQDCAVIGVPDDTWGEAVKAPKSVDFVAALPRSPVGKVLKKDLREPYWQGAARRI